MLNKTNKGAPTARGRGPADGPLDDDHNEMEFQELGVTEYRKTYLLRPNS